MLDILAFIYLGGIVLSALVFALGIVMFHDFARDFPQDAKMISELLKFWFEIAGRHIFLWPWYMVGRPIYCLVQIKRGKMAPLNS